MPSYIEDVVNNKKLFIIVHSKGYSRYKGLGWILALDYDSADIFEAVVILRNKLLGFSFLIAIISILLGLLVAQSISKPIFALKQASLEIGKGNLSAKIDIHTKDEIEELAKSFMQMTMQLQNTTVTKEYVENIIESMVDGVSIVDLDGKIVTINNAAVKQNGYTKKNVLFGLKMEKIICEEDISKYEKIIKKLFLGEIAENEYLKFMRKNGSVYIARVNASILTDKSGKPKAIIIVHQDVTDIKNTEEQLKKNEERYRITSEQTGQLIFDYDPRTGQIKWFGAIEEITGYTKEEFGSVDVVNWTQKIHPSDRKEVLSMIEKAQKNCTKYDIQYRLLKKCGTYIFIEEHGVFLPDENGRVCRMCGTIIDVTERNEREKDIRERESFLASVIENIPNMVFIKDAKELRFVRMNKAGEELLGYKKEEMIGKNDYDFFPKKEADFFSSKDYFVLSNRMMDDIEEEVIHTRSKGERILHTKKIPIFDEKGEAEYLLGISEDITERKRSEEEIKFRNVLLQTQQEVSIDGILVVDRKGVILSFNKRFVDMWQIPTGIIETRSDKIVLQSIMDKLFFPEEFMSQVEQLYKTPEQITKDEVFLKDGRTFDRYSSPMIGPQKEYYGRVWYFRDITERKMAEQEVKNSKIHLELALLGGGLGTWEWNIPTGELLMDERWAEMKGYCLDELTPHISTWEKLVHPEDLSRVWEILKRHLDGKTSSYEAELRMQHKSGKWIWILDKGQVIERDKDGKAVRACGTHSDITERKESEKSLKESEENYRALFENSMDAIMVLDLDKGFVQVNDQTIKMFGCKDENEIIFLMPEKLSPEKQPDGQLSLKKAKEMINIAFKNGSHFFEWQHKRFSGEEFTATVLLSKIDIKGKSVLQATVRDVTEQKQFEKKIIELAKFPDEDVNPVMRISKEGILLYANKASESFLKCFKMEIGKSAIEDLVSIVNNVINSKQTIQKDYHCADRIVHIFFTFVDNEEYVNIYAYDVTERRKAEEEVLKADERFMTVLHASDDAILLIDDNKFIECNDATRKMLGYSNKEEFLNAHPSVLSPEFQPDGTRSSEKADQMIAIAVKEGFNRFEWIHTRVHGENFPVEVSLTPISYKGKTIIHCLWRDISNEKEAMENLHQFKTIVKQAPEGIVVIDIENRIFLSNGAWAAMHGYKNNEDFQGKDISMFFDSLVMQKKVKPFIAKVIQEGRSFLEMENLRKDKEEFPIALIGAVLKDENEKAYAIALFASDISERKKAELAIREKDAAELANRTKSEFLANMSHEIRTPMNAILGFTELLDLTELNEYQSDLVETIESSGQMLISIIEDVLDISKIEAGKILLEKITFNLEHFLENIIKIVNQRIKDKKIKIKTTISSDVPMFLEGDPTRLRQILINLLSNAIKFTDKGEISIFIRSHKKKEQDVRELMFSVKDTGIGIDQKAKEIIFNSFTQADMTTTRKYGGTGLGLYICKKLVELMGGNIWVESEKGKGSEFFFTVKIKERPAIIKEDIHPIDCLCLKSKKILLVENNSKSAKSLKVFFDDCQLGFDHVDSAKKAIDLLIKKMAIKDSLPDIILMDLMLAEKSDGLELLEKIKKQPLFKNIKLVAISSDPRVGVANKAQEMGFNGVFPMTISREEFRDVLCTVLGDKRIDGQIITRHMAAELNCKGLNVLIAEDNIVNQKLMKMMLTNLGCSIDVADDGRQVIEKLKQGKYDIVLMDLQMPVLGGIDATKIIRAEINKQIPILALTAAVQKSDKKLALASGMNDFISKPVKMITLKYKIMEWINKGV
ncbi:MAG: PAS domain S-box protein [Candidatus Omnitrophica bacterium]|nr:PAS domain S-box protein [Candidatus Omnitrophota bacterium]